MANFDTMVQWSTDEEFEYILPDNKPLTVSWNMYGDEVGITTSDTGWDATMICYPCVFRHGENTYMFYKFHIFYLI